MVCTTKNVSRLVKMGQFSSVNIFILDNADETISYLTKELSSKKQGKTFNGVPDVSFLSCLAKDFSKLSD